MRYRNEQGMDRINSDIQKDKERRQVFTSSRNDQLELELSPGQLQRILKLSNVWAFSERHIDDVFFDGLRRGNSDQAAHRLTLIEEVSARIQLLLREDQIRIVRWLRRALPNLGGRRPLDLLMGEESDIEQLIESLATDTNSDTIQYRN